MERRPDVLVFDVNETLSDLTPLEDEFDRLGLGRHRVPWWFAAVLRDGMAHAAAGDLAAFADLARDVVRSVPGAGAGAPDAVVEAFLDLPVHPDVVAGVDRLAGLGLRLVTLSNGAAEVAERLLGRAGIRDRFEAVLSVADAGVWKPARAAYTYAARACGVSPEGTRLVAVHPWDVHGAAAAGAATAWIDRVGTPYPSTFTPPDVAAADLVDLAARLQGGG